MCVSGLGAQAIPSGGWGSADLSGFPMSFKKIKSFHPMKSSKVNENESTKGKWVEGRILSNKVILVNSYWTLPSPLTKLLLFNVPSSTLDSYDLTYMWNPEKLNLQNQSIEQWLPGSGGGGNGEMLVKGSKPSIMSNFWDLTYSMVTGVNSVPYTWSLLRG